MRILQFLSVCWGAGFTCVYLHHVPAVSEEDTVSLETGVRDGCEPPCGCKGTQSCLSAKSASALGLFCPLDGNVLQVELARRGCSVNGY